MTATLPARGPLTGRPVSLRRPRSVYGIPIYDPATDTIRIDYVGKTIRDVAIREAEHRGLGRNPECEQPWSDLIRGRAVVLESDAHLPEPWSDAELADRERCWIRNEEVRLPHRPRYNIEHGLDNPDHIPQWVARRQRADRDYAQGIVSRWTNPHLFTGPVMLPSPVQGPSLWSRFWRSPLGQWLSRKLAWAGRWTAGLGAVWFGLWLGVLWLARRTDAPTPASDAAGIAAALTVLGVAIWQAKRRRPRKTTSSKKRHSRTNQRRMT